MDNISIRKGTVDDCDIVASYNIAMALESEGKELVPEIITEGVKRALEGNVGAIYYVAVSSEPNGGVVGQLMITTEWSDWRCAPIWWIQSVYVTPSLRKRGIFKALYHHAKEAAKEAGSCGLRLYADDHNTNAHATYERLGMTSHYKVFEDMFS
jgi:GNAT superfamily N-acetyltransferase